MKRLYIVIGDAGDGSQFLRYTFDEKEIDKLIEAEDNGTLEDCWQSGDGLQLQILTVPDECTYKSLDIDEWELLEAGF